MNPPHIVLSGYYGFGNAGDEAILAGILTGFKQLAPEVQVTVLSHRPAETQTSHGVRAISRWGLGEIWKALKECDLLISGGGGLLQDVTSRRSILYYLGILYLAQRLGKPTMVLGQSIGPIKGKFSARLARAVLNRVSRITVRDSRSLELLEELGVERPPMEVTADPALAIPPPESGIEANMIAPSSEALGICLRSWAGQEVWLPELARAIKLIIERTSLHPILIPFQPSKDSKICEHLSQKLDKELAIADNIGDIRQILAIIGQMKVLLGMRLHSLTFSAMMGIPFFALSYDPKVEEFAQALNMPYCRINMLEASVIVEKVQELKEKAPHLRNQLLDWAAEARPLALRNMEIAIELLK